MESGGVLKGIITSAILRQSPLCQSGLKIPIKLIANNSNKQFTDRLLNLVQNYHFNKNHLMTDEKLSKNLKEEGYDCIRSDTDNGRQFCS